MIASLAMAGWRRSEAEPKPTMAVSPFPAPVVDCRGYGCWLPAAHDHFLPSQWDFADPKSRRSMGEMSPIATGVGWDNPVIPYGAGERQLPPKPDFPILIASVVGYAEGWPRTFEV